MIKQELAYWMALAHLPKMRSARKNEIIVQCFEQQISIIELFSTEEKWKTVFQLTEAEILLMQQARSELANYSFLVEDLLAQGYTLIPITSPDYSPLLKKNLKYGAPVLLYVKGNVQLLKEQSVAIVGSRMADESSLQFTHAVAYNAVQEDKVVVSGFAKGVDQLALESALQAHGKSILVLPQGIMTFGSGVKKYYQPLVDGKVLIVSVFFPKAPWSVELAMARNPIIYGLAGEIFVAQSEEKGGTWAGVIDGLRKKRTIYVRKSMSGELIANDKLLAKGAIPVDMTGQIMVNVPLPSPTPDLFEGVE